METLLKKDGVRVLVFTEEVTRRLAVANQAIRYVRTRAGLPRVSEVHIDSVYPLILLEGTPPELLLDTVSGLYSRKLDTDDGRYVVRCTAYGCDWSWISARPAVHISRQPALRPALPKQALPDNVVPHLMFGGRRLQTAGSAQ